MTNQIADYRLTCNPDQTHTEDQSAMLGGYAQVLCMQEMDIHSMSHNETAHKAEIISVSRAEFLAALFEKADPALWLEIRCIHPVTEAVRVRWTPLGDRRRLANNLRQADVFNREGYDELFAPCLRGERKGTAEAAVLVPALWVDVDCDDDPARRSAALDTLHSFDPKPSIILDSGGGWHVYWLLDEPVPLPDDAAREHIANILQGLFDAVGGDIEYSKSVASLMRLPNTANAKPERGGVVARVAEFHPERRSPLAAFEWLAVKAQPVKSLPVRLASGNGHASLPQVTLDYLARGASNGSRNRALFDAACQFRDAGYSQTEAETELIARHVAGGVGNENPAGREREARATISSWCTRTGRASAQPVQPPRLTGAPDTGADRGSDLRLRTVGAGRVGGTAAETESSMW